MQVIEGKDIDLISPFPLRGIPNAVSWMHSFRTFIIEDGGPATDEELGQHLQGWLGRSKSWAVIDKHNLTHSKSVDVPLVGLGIFDMISPSNGYIHVCSSRRAWGGLVEVDGTTQLVSKANKDLPVLPGMIEQGGEIILKQIFEDNPTLRRISASIVSTNKASIALALRLGFKKDGYFKEAIMQNNEPKDIIHLGLLRPQQVKSAEA